MSKDPAVLLYTSDFLTGTMLLSNEQTGKYIKLLCIQHQKGRLTKDDMLKICLTYDKDVFDKFTEDENGLYYNVRMDQEITKRKNYSDSRRKNRLSKPKKKKTSKTYVPHMGNEDENKDIIKDEDKNFFTPIKNKWFEVYQDAKGTKPTFGPIEGLNLKRIIAKLKTKATETVSDWTEEMAVINFHLICDHALKTKWVKDNFDLKIINSKFDIIYAKAIKGANNLQELKDRIDALPKKQGLETDYDLSKYR